MLISFAVGADQLRHIGEADHAFVFAIRIVEYFFFLNSKCLFSSMFLCLYVSVLFDLVGNLEDWFSRVAAQFLDFVSVQETIKYKASKSNS